MGNIEEDKERYAALAAAAKERNKPKRFEISSARVIRTAWEGVRTDGPPPPPTLADWERELLDEPTPVRNTGPGFCICGCGLPIGQGGVAATTPPAPRRGIAAMPGVDRYEPRGQAIELTPAITTSEAWANVIRSTTRTREEMDNLNRTLNRQIELRYAYDARGPIPSVIDPIQRG